MNIRKTIYATLFVLLCLTACAKKTLKAVEQQGNVFPNSEIEDPVLVNVNEPLKSPSPNASPSVSPTPSPSPSPSSIPTPTPSASPHPSPTPSPSPLPSPIVSRRVIIAEGNGGLNRVGGKDFLRNYTYSGTISALTGYNYSGGTQVSAGRVKDFIRNDIITGPNPGATPLIEVWNGDNGSRLQAFLAYDAQFVGGVSLATCDLFGDSRDELVTGALSNGGAHVKVFDLRGQTPVIAAQFMAYEINMNYGIHVACSGNQITVAPNGGGTGSSHVKVFNTIGNATTLLVSDTPSLEFFAFDPSFTGGTLVARGDLNGDGISEIITAQAVSSERTIRIYNTSGIKIGEFSAFNAASYPFSGSMSLAVGDVNGDGKADIIVGSGAGGNSYIRVFTGFYGTLLNSETLSSILPSFNSLGGVGVGFISP